MEKGEEGILCEDVASLAESMTLTSAEFANNAAVSAMWCRSESSQCCHCKSRLSVELFPQVCSKKSLIR